MEPQLAVALTPDKIWKYSHYSMEPKLDGIRCIAYRDDVGFVHLTSRGSKDLTAKVPHITDLLEKVLPRSTRLDGELGYWAGNYTLDFNKTTRVLGSGVEVALEKQAEHEDDIQYFVFDMPSFGAPDYVRRNLLEEWHKRYVRGRFENYESPVVLLPRMPRWDEEWYDAYVLAGGEGVMLKNPEAYYDPGGRHANNWYKVKKFDTIDVFIVGYKEGEGKYQSMLGALNVQVPGKGNESCFWVAGMDDEWRKEFYDNFQEYHSKMIEVKHFGLTAGTPRFPQFLRMRPDLD